MIDLGLVIKGASLAVSVGKYVGIVEDQLALAIDQLRGSELEAGLRALQQAASSDAEQQSLLREARARFNKAVSLEKDLRLAAAYIGIALCHVHLNDPENAERAIDELSQMQATPISPLLQAGRIAGNTSVLIAAVPIIGPLVKLYGNFSKSALDQHDEIVTRLEVIKAGARKLLDQSLRKGCQSVFHVAGPKVKKERPARKRPARKAPNDSRKIK